MEYNCYYRFWKQIILYWILLFTLFYMFLCFWVLCNIQNTTLLNNLIDIKPGIVIVLFKSRSSSPWALTEIHIIAMCNNVTRVLTIPFDRNASNNPAKFISLVYIVDSNTPSRSLWPRSSGFLARWESTNAVLRTLVMKPIVRCIYILHTRASRAHVRPTGFSQHPWGAQVYLV